MRGALGAVLFDWRGTPFHDEDDAAWIRASAASIGQTLTTQEVNARVEMLGAAAEHPQVVAGHQTADCSAGSIGRPYCSSCVWRASTMHLHTRFATATATWAHRAVF